MRDVRIDAYKRQNVNQRLDRLAWDFVLRQLFYTGPLKRQWLVYLAERSQMSAVKVSTCITWMKKVGIVEYTGTAGHYGCKLTLEGVALAKEVLISVQ